MLSYAVYTIWTGVERYDGRYFKNISDGKLTELTNMDRLNFGEPSFPVWRSKFFGRSTSFEKYRNLSNSSELNLTVDDLNEREFAFFNTVTFDLKGKLRNHEPNSTASCVCRVLNIQVLICTRDNLINHQKRLQ